MMVNAKKRQSHTVWRLLSFLFCTLRTARPSARARPRSPARGARLGRISFSHINKVRGPRLPGKFM